MKLVVSSLSLHQFALLMPGCAGLDKLNSDMSVATTAATTGCPPSAITISNLKTRWSNIVWEAQCVKNKKSYYCTKGKHEDLSCRVQIQ